ncbi:MAG TPA: S8 family serine peptidase [Verrucomicrobiae bacterium]
MKNLTPKIIALTLLFVGIFFPSAHASYLDTIGVTSLREATTNLDGSGIDVGQPEADDSGSPPGTNTWEIRPNAVGQPTNLFTYFKGIAPYISVNTANTYPNSLGFESGHAEIVARNFYGFPDGVATNVAHVDDYQADTFYNYYIAMGHSISERIVNQSFTFGTNDAGVNQTYDNYAAQNNVLFISGAGFDGQPVYSPATCYNGLGVGVSDVGNSPYGPTSDGRSKPDICAPGFPDFVTSYTTPQVSGAAAILLQAALRGDGGSDTNSAADMRTLKALLLNGAVKPIGWTNSNSAPLDTHYGAGVLNVLNSYEQLAGGKNNFISATAISPGDPHPPDASTGTISKWSGWDFNSIASADDGFFSTAADGVNHYFFNVTNNLNGANFTLTATLVWNRQQNQTDINHLDLFLYNCADSNLVACSTSLVDNVEHIFFPRLAPGRYDLQVLKHGGNFVSASETYALAWEFFSQTLNVEQIGTNVALTFPIYPAGFSVEATTNLSPPIIWSASDLPPPIFTNGQNFILLNATNPARFFRLREPDF